MQCQYTPNSHCDLEWILKIKMLTDRKTSLAAI